MNKRSLLWMYAFLLLLAGCSSDDDSRVAMDQYICGYWERIEDNASGQGGLLFTSDGEIKSWSFNNDCTSNTYSEEHWGYYWLDDEGQLEIRNLPKNSEPCPDEQYYKVMSLTKDCLVIRAFGGFFGTPLEKGYDVEYKKKAG